MKNYYIYRLSGEKAIYYITNLEEGLLQEYRVPKIEHDSGHWAELANYYRTGKWLTKFKLENNYSKNRQLRSYLSAEQNNEQIRQFMMSAFNGFKDIRDFIKSLLSEMPSTEITDASIFKGLEEKFLQKLLTEFYNAELLYQAYKDLKLFDKVELVKKISIESVFEIQFLEVLSASSDEEFTNYFFNPENMPIINEVTKKIEKFLPKAIIHEHLYNIRVENNENLSILANWYQSQLNVGYVSLHHHPTLDKWLNKKFTRTHENIIKQAAEQLDKIIAQRKVDKKPLYSEEEYDNLLKSNLLLDIHALGLDEFDFNFTMPFHIMGIVDWYNNLPKFIFEHRPSFWNNLSNRSYTKTNMRILKGAIERIEKALTINKHLSESDCQTFCSSKLYKDLYCNFKERMTTINRRIVLNEEHNGQASDLRYAF